METMSKWLIVSISFLSLLPINHTVRATNLPRQGLGANGRSTHPASERQFRQISAFPRPPPPRPPLAGPPFVKQGPSLSPFPPNDEWNGPFGALPHPPSPHPFPVGPGAPPLGLRDFPAGGHHEGFDKGPGGCNTVEGFRFAGEVWYANGCRRRKCIHFRGSFFTETDECDTEIYNTTYKCIVEVDTQADYPRCCPKYRCNPDNLGNDVK